MGKSQRAVLPAGVGVDRVQGHTRQLVERGFELAAQRVDVGIQVDLQRAGQLAQYLGQTVQPAQLGQLHGAAELVQGHGGQVVRLVKDQQAVAQLGQGFHAQRGQHQVVVGHDDVGLGQAGTRLVVAAIAVARAVPGGAAVALGGDARPVLRVRRLDQTVAVAIPAAGGQGLRHVFVEPETALLQGFLRSTGQRHCWEVILKKVLICATDAGHALEFELADIAPAALGQCKCKGLLHGLGQRGQVFLHELLLQRDGGRRNQHPRLALQGHGDGHAGISGRFAHACASLHHANRLFGLRAIAQVAFAQGVGHALGHGFLAGALAKTGARLHHMAKGGHGIGRHGAARGRAGRRVGGLGLQGW